ncbi:COP1-interactive protein 1 isoform X1 [Vicia villosa]|uniref:COP1-interactive protein 1 isoform X1 n=1 Tax=Vicia villosa TaxID=3911 RepID=UPI00273CED55|nr:COP1-interactive protein 1 isoform X1 [Vicia villosa]
MLNSNKPEPSNADYLERRNWGNVFNLLVQMVKNQQNQLQSFANQQKFLEDRLKMQNQRWASDVKQYKNQISQIKSLLIFEEKKRVHEALKAELMMGYKEREASVLKWMLDGAEEDLEDFKAGFDILSVKGTSSSGKNSSPDETKDKHDKLAAEQNTELLALLEEKKFVWNQFNKMEADYSNKLRSKQDEVIKANETISTLVSRMEELQSENSKKDSRISELESKVADRDTENSKKDSRISKLESKVADISTETNRLNKEISELSAELESLRKLKNNKVKPLSKRCTAGSSDSGTIESSRSRRKITFDKELCTSVEPASTSTNFSEKDSSSRNRSHVRRIEGN